MIKIFIVATLIVCSIAQTKNDDLVKTVPEWPEHTFNTYSGYLKLDGGKRNYHYAFLESQNKPESDPVVLWLNGGPGCSSMLGLLTEVGPYLIDDQGKWRDDKLGWNMHANMLFLESPAGVGFSTINDPTFVYNDANTAKDNYDAIKLWFERFPEYKGREFWISGESYGGMYIPWLAREIINGNKQTPDNQINMKGVLIGNGRMNTDSQLTENAQTQYFINRNFFDYKTNYALENQCKSFKDSYSCQQAEKTANNAVKNINVYNIYGYCYNTDTTKEEYKLQSQKQYKFPYTTWAHRVGDSSDPPCTNGGPVQNYLNNPDNKKAWHVDESVTFGMCNMNINSVYNVSPEGSYKILYDIHEAGGKILVYSGDLDAAVSVEETMQTLSNMKLTVTQAWTPFADEETVVQGWSIKYDILDFVIVRAAGHMVPGDQRKTAFNMFNNFIQNKAMTEVIQQ